MGDRGHEQVTNYQAEVGQAMIPGHFGLVIVDDYLPMGCNDELLCSFSTNRNELWVSFLEKAYMKVMGGYDFPGSNSNIDLHALTGWIPERVPIKPSTGVFNADREYRRLASRFHQGHCLVTVATGVLSPSDESRSGLVPTHAYALLDMQEVGSTRLLLLKNPWSRTKWKGNYSDQDKEHWTTEMQKRLNFDVNVAQYVDNGVFWIDYKSLCHFFDVFYINWNPDLFPYTTCVHSEWSAATGPKKDIYSYANNPQYTLEVRTKTQAPVWILLTRHITNKEKMSTGSYRRGYTMMELAGLAGGKYQLIVATFEPRQEGPFIISLRSLRPVEIRCIQ
nr:unnamed protein product [Spirometra erinaceieuropaei]